MTIDYITIEMKKKSPEKKHIQKLKSSIEIGMHDIMNVQRVETSTYPFPALISDTGGAGGLFLGLHMIGLPENVFFIINFYFKE